MNVSKLEEASSHKSAKTHARRHCFCDSWPWLWTSKDLRVNKFSRLVMDRVYVKFGNPSCFGFLDIMWTIETNKPTNQQIRKRR